MQKSPLLYWALFFLLGCSASLLPHIALLAPLALLVMLTKTKLQGVAFCVLGATYTYFQVPAHSFETIEGRGHFVAESIAPSQSPFQRSIALKGHFRIFEDLKSVPCTLFVKKLPQAGSSWILEGKLTKKNTHSFAFKPKKDSPWIEVKRPFSLARFRYENKERVRHFFHKKYPNTPLGHFFASMATGDTDDRLLSMQFQKLGLSHILAISGFHFALLAMLLGLFLRWLLPPKGAYSILLLLLTLYFLFLGASPSIFRAYVMITLYLSGLLTNRRSDGLNLLGCALLLELILNPLALTHIGFQLSFLATFGILTLYRPCQKLFTHLLPSRPLSELKGMSRLDQHGYLVSSAIREGLALNTAVHLTTLPLLLFTFGFFPWMSLPYNLVLPPLLSLSLLLLPIGILFPPIEWVNARFTSWLLRLLEHPPEILNYKLFTPQFPFWLIVLLLTLIVGIPLKLRQATSGENHG